MLNFLEAGMKVNVEVDCSPEEARRFLGLPDVTKANEVYVDAVANAMKGVGSFDQLQDFAKQFYPMGQLGMEFFQKLMAGGLGASGKKDAK
jgi:hypothetical protein